MDTQKITDYWLEDAEKDFKVANGLYKLKYYSHCLFLCHLTIEKLLKALVTRKTGELAPFIHDLPKLARLAGLDLTPEQLIEQLEVITTFNIRARYPDIKLAFYKKCTKEYTEKYFSITKNFYQWLKKESLQK